MLTVQIIDLLLDFEHHANDVDFTNAFGQNLGQHLWRKFSYEYKHDLTTLCRYLDGDNLQLLVNYINNNWETQ
jgi:hypothetical protein